MWFSTLGGAIARGLSVWMGPADAGPGVVACLGRGLAWSGPGAGGGDEVVFDGVCVWDGNSRVDFRCAFGSAVVDGALDEGGDPVTRYDRGSEGGVAGLIGIERDRMGVAA